MGFINCFEILASMMIWFLLWIVHATDTGDRQHHFPALACGFGKVLTAFHMAQRWNEQTQPATWRMSSCKPAKHFQSWKHLETSQQHPADRPGTKLAPATFICSGHVGPELIPCCSCNFSHAPWYSLLTLQRTLFMWAQDYQDTWTISGPAVCPAWQVFLNATQLLSSSVETRERPETWTKPVSPPGPNSFLGWTAECL